MPHRSATLAWALMRARPSARRSPSPACQVPEDDEDAAFREAMVRRSLQENCLICHTEDMIAGQRLTPVAVEGRGREDGQLGLAAAEGGRRCP